MIQRVSNWCIWILQPGFISLNKVTVVLRNTVIIALVIVKIELKFILNLHYFLIILQLGHPLFIERFLLRLRMLIIVFFLV